MTKVLEFDEANVCASLAMLGDEAAYLTVLPKNAVTESFLKHSVKGDFNYVNRSEVLSLMGGGASGRVKR